MNISPLVEDKELLLERYNLARNRIQEITKEHIDNKYASYFAYQGNHILKCMDLLESPLELKDIEDVNVDELQEENSDLFSDFWLDNYNESYLNPEYAVKIFGEKLGGRLAFLATEFTALIPWSIDKRIDLITIYAELFLEIYGGFSEEHALQEAPSLEDEAFQNIYKEINDSIYWFYHDYAEIFTYDSVINLVTVRENIIADIIENANLNKTNYLYAYGMPISENEVELSKYIATLSEEKVEKIAATYVNGFVKGFEMTRKDLSIKSTVKVEYPIGFERVVRRAKELFKEEGLSAIFTRDGVFSFDGMRRQRNAYTSSMNPQFYYDHKNDKGYYFDKRFYNRRLECLEEAFKMYKKEAKDFAGPAVIETFGEAEFNPINKPENYKYTDKQNKWNVEYLSKAGEINNTFIPSEEYSFTIIAFPLPEIGDEETFTKIFDETLELNTLDYDKYQRIQQLIIDALDEGEKVRIVGKKKVDEGGKELYDNLTELVVSLHTLEDKDKQTNFENCVADVNIPVGEVFTSPVLKGTTGRLNVSRVFLNGLVYNDLVIDIQDGMIVDYSCSNFDSEDECKRYFFENVLMRHETLPMGEFAIGTNTLAYTMARKYNIEDKLPILIAEKTGPHFAFGDTCYSHAEDVAMYNPDGKEVIARENECSMKRNTEPEKAYFNCHTDVTIPYDEIGVIEVVKADNTTIPIIENGRFVLAGVEELNEPLDRLAKY